MRSKGSAALTGWLEQSGLTQKQFAERLRELLKGDKITQTTVSNWQNGRNCPHGRALVAINAITGIAFGDWIEDAEDAPKTAA